jgi:DNA topoisomerase VI subunit B
VIFVHMASVWVPFTSESKEAIADYDEIQKEITLALRECGRRLGLFLRRRERAAGEYRRRNIFELYIEEVAEACNRLKGGKLQTEKLKAQLQKIANSRTGGQKTDEALGKKGGGPEGLPDSIIVTAEGVEGAVEIANQVEADLAQTAAEAPQATLLPEDKPAKQSGKDKGAKAVKPGKLESAKKGKADQLGLFAGAKSGKKAQTKAGKTTHAKAPRGKK